MMEWNVDVAVQGRPAEDDLARLGKDMDQSGLDVSVYGKPGDNWGIGIGVDAVDHHQAFTAAMDILAKLNLDGVPVAAVEVSTLDEMERKAEEATAPDLVSSVEAADILGVRRQRVHQLWRERADFPAPLYRLRPGPLWARRAVEAFAVQWERKPGRPKAS